MKLIYIFIFYLMVLTTSAREGMWMPQLLKELNESDMKSMGMKISAEDIYSINKSSLKDAVLLFGSGCTGELISPNGLLITNHHCGFSQIQSLSTIEKNYLTNGFWSKSLEEEIPCPKLTVTFIREIRDVTSEILLGVSDELNEDSRSALIKTRTDSIERTISGKLKGTIKQFYQGNKFYLFTTETYSDIRFVGAPPQSIGKFGGETDNWVWPRHTGDFSLFRIYADKENNPAQYSKENIPYTPKKFLTINIKGVNENDFVFVFGFPGKTNQYLPASALEVIEEQTNPNRIGIREVRLDAMREAMSSNDTVKLQYSSKFSTLENAYKKWQGELLGFRRFDAVKQKKMKDEDFNSRLLKNSDLKKDVTIISQYDSINLKAKPLNFANDYYAEAFPGIELIGGTMRLKKLVAVASDKTNDDKAVEEELNKVKSDFRGFYKNYNAALDRKICAEVLKLAGTRLGGKYIPKTIMMEETNGNDLVSYSNKLFNNSLAADSTRLMDFLSGFERKDTARILEDPAYRLGLEISEIQLKLQEDLGKMNVEINRLQRIYIKDLLAMDKTGKLYPDANLTLRVSYGKVEGTEARDGVHYNYFTTADGMIAKSEKGESDYEMPSGLATLIKTKDYGQYSTNGTLPVAFLASTHTTGGNSGSPVLNARGELVGVNYDRMWEGVLSDYYYDEKYCRNISLDIRYALFVIEKYGKAGRLIEEMKIVK